MCSDCFMDFQDHDLETRLWFVKNFGPELKEIITESRYFEQLGFSVPGSVRQVAVHQDKYFR